MPEKYPIIVFRERSIRLSTLEIFASHYKLKSSSIEEGICWNFETCAIFNILEAIFFPSPPLSFINIRITYFGTIVARLHRGSLSCD